MIVLTLLIALCLGLVHVFGGRLSALASSGTERRWLSVCGGITVAFVFLYLLPELEYFRSHVAEHPTLGAFDEFLYLTVLIGVALYYGLEHLAYRARSHYHEVHPEESDPGHDYVFWLHMGWYAVYNIIIAVLLSHGEQETMRGLAVYGLVMAVHFVSVDAVMRRHHRHVYRKTGRWILAGAVVTGWGLGAFTSPSTTVVAIIIAFLAGGLLINAIKDELPSSEWAHFVSFLIGVAVFATIVIAL